VSDKPRVTISLDEEVYGLLVDLCYTRIDGIHVEKRKVSDVAREALVRGLKEMLREKMAIESSSTTIMPK